MKTLTDRELYAAQTAEFISLLGTKKICRVCQRSPQALTGWKRRGMPLSWRLVFKQRYPAEFKKVFGNEETH